MNNVLYIKSSVLGQTSQTNAQVDALHARWSAEYPQATHTVKDLAQEPLPHLTAAHLAQAPESGQLALQELKAADRLVIAAPMYNFSIPSTLKAWFDHVLKAGQTFEYTEQGPRGLLAGKSAVVLVGSGGVYSEGPYAAADFVVPYIKTLLGFIGITDVQVIRAEGLAQGAAGVQSVARAKAELAQVP